VFDPSAVCSDYDIELEPSDEKLLKMLKSGRHSADSNSIRGLKLLAIATVPEDFKNTTLNLKAPIVVNTNNNLAVQIVHPLNYEFRCPLYKDGWEYEDGCEECDECDECRGCEECNGSAETGEG
jgi:flagellar assembly factor FliW